MPPSQVERDRLVVQHLRRAVPDLVAVYRFGSTARGESRPGSDTDLAVLASRRIAESTRFDIQEELASLIGTDVDLVDLSATTPVLAIQIVTDGQVLYDGDDVRRGAFEDRTFGDYARLNEERRGILERIAHEGTVHGR